MKNTRFVSFAVATLFAGVCAAADEGPRYTFGEVGYSHTDIDNVDADGDLLGIKGSVALTDLFHLFGAYSDGELDGDGPGEIDITTSRVGGGINFPLNTTVDLVGGVSWVYYELDAGPFEVDDDGLGLNGGVRAMLTPQFELNGMVNYVEIDNDDDTSVEVGGVYSFTDMFAGTAGVSFSDDATTYGIGLRVYLVQ